VTGALFALLAASSGSKTGGSSSSTTFIIFLVLIAVVGYFLLIRPQKQKQRRQREQQQAIGVGDEVLTVGGIVGRVTAIDSDRVTILSGVDTVGFPAMGTEPTRLVLVRNAIARKVEPPVPDVTDMSDDDPTHDVGDDGTEFDGHADGQLNGHVDGHDSTLHGDAGDGAESESEDTAT
jgi:preprotein translocase subunit YajC